MQGAIEAAGLGGVLNRTDVIGTLFAPTNDAIIRTQTALANNSLGVNLMYPQVVQMVSRAVAGADAGAGAGGDGGKGAAGLGQGWV